MVLKTSSSRSIDSDIDISSSGELGVNQSSFQSRANLSLIELLCRDQVEKGEPDFFFFLEVVLVPEARLVPEVLIQ